jgi:pyruvate dehydrogenase E2 component (dihydrolipoamide acetyltransferase)
MNLARIPGDDERLSAPRADRVDVLSTRERWPVDARRAVGIPGGIVQQTVEMTRAREALRVLRGRGLAATFTHVLVRATALALARNPRTYQMVCGYDRLTPGSIDVGVSTNDAPGALPAVVAGVERTPLGALIAPMNDALAGAAPSAPSGVARGGAAIGFVRRWLIRRSRGAFGSRRGLAGVIEVAHDARVDVFAPLRFHSDALLGAGRVRDVVVVRGGVPVVRPVVHLSLSLDHVALDGVRGASLLHAVKAIVEGDELLAEALAGAETAPAR